MLRVIPCCTLSLLLLLATQPVTAAPLLLSFEAGARLERLLPQGVGIDLVPVESAPGWLLDSAEREGRVLHGPA